MTRPRTLSGFIASRVFAGDPLLGEIWRPGKARPKAVEATKEAARCQSAAKIDPLLEWSSAADSSVKTGSLSER